MDLEDRIKDLEDEVFKLTIELEQYRICLRNIKRAINDLHELDKKTST